MSGILSTQMSQVPREPNPSRSWTAGSTAARQPRRKACARAMFCVAWVARPKPGPASPANVSKRGLFARLSAPDQTLIMVNGRLPKGILGAGNEATAPGSRRAAAVDKKYRKQPHAMKDVGVSMVYRHLYTSSRRIPFRGSWSAVPEHPRPCIRPGRRGSQPIRRRFWQSRRC